jgi:hypothetical protein
VGGILDEQAAVNAKLREVRAAIAAGDEERVLALTTEVDALTATADGRWDAFGLVACGSGFDA